MSRLRGGLPWLLSYLIASAVLVRRHAKKAARTADSLLQSD